MIGLMGGTFSPIHYGHLLMCETIREEFEIEKIIFMPAKSPPHKDVTHIIDAKHRIEMVKLAIKDNRYFEVSDLEMHRKGASYTADTLKILKESSESKNSKNDLALIIGADSLMQIETWSRFKEIFLLSTIIVASRPDTDEKILDDYIEVLSNKYFAKILKSSNQAMNYSSTTIRERIKKGLSIRYLVPPLVEAYIYEQGLYG